MQCRPGLNGPRKCQRGLSSLLCPVSLFPHWPPWAPKVLYGAPLRSAFLNCAQCYWPSKVFCGAPLTSALFNRMPSEMQRVPFGDVSTAAAAVFSGIGSDPRRSLSAIPFSCGAFCCLQRVPLGDVATAAAAMPSEMQRVHFWDVPTAAFCGHAAAHRFCETLVMPTIG